MNDTTRALIVTYSALPESIKAACPRPTALVTTERVRAWLVDLRATCLLAAASATEAGELTTDAMGARTAAILREEARAMLTFAAQVADIIGYPTSEEADSALQKLVLMPLLPAFGGRGAHPDDGRGSEVERK